MRRFWNKLAPDTRKEIAGNSVFFAFVLFFVLFGLGVYGASLIGGVVAAIWFSVMFACCVALSLCVLILRKICG